MAKNQIIKVERSIYTLFNFLGDVGGLISVFGPFISAIVKIFSSINMKSNIALKLFLQPPIFSISPPIKVKKS